MKPSDVTVTDLFCGAGGSSIGAAAAGARLRMGLNHWKLAIETHNTNFPDADHDCTDVSACDPRRYPSTTVLIASPECTNHSLAKGQRRKHAGQGDIFQPAPDDPASIRSRATMWDVCRFTEAHRYELVIVENVIDARMWVCWNAWLHAMHCMGYEHRAVYLNSMFAHPTPQSRDRMYVVFWRKGNRAPDLEIRPPAWCPACERSVEAVQSWKQGRNAGRYRRQYVYCCAACAAVVEPFYYAALNAIDWTIPAERIGDRSRPLQPRTLDRIRYGLDKYGRQPLVVTTRYTTGASFRVRDAAAEALPTQPGHASHAFVHPFIVDTARSDAPEHRTHPVAGAALPTQTTQRTHGVAYPPAVLMTYRNYEGTDGYPVSALTDPLRTIVTTGQERLIINGAAVVNLRDWRKVEQLCTTPADPLPTQVTAQQVAVVTRGPFLVSYYGQDQAGSVAEAMGTLATRDRHALIDTREQLDEINVDDCYFRMLQPHEIGAGMAFPDSYVVLGTKRDRVKQYGNAVTPPAMQLLMNRGLAALEGT